ncbi:DJ-1/PfpI family protein [Streptomyces sp. AV19]|uniref:DJ-1/PfpI family protein n=1 Tax=Streptomyces sp. AV19 TaxID=2793068 RepID=UPI0018FEE859|nr:DJ-1/PfpI family protein [Streptomyces sp. AV19]MBH1933878.1 DJ-1/PfpI family protein [Streptomyces sp. AV19]MDG4535634.1 DJ-1/PfpI family protein [Streptomyces sp. AV19]
MQGTERNDRVCIGLLVYPDINILDITGPAELFASSGLVDVQLVWKTTTPVRTSGGWHIVPTLSFPKAPQLDVICVPGGRGQIGLMHDDETLDFLKQQAAGARYVTSVCTGALVLGAAGLLRGHRATTHWLSHDQLGLFGATPVRERVVVDGNRITGGGVTAGMDFALVLLAELFGEQEAHAVQLAAEYDPAPPYAAGRPDLAPPDVLELVRSRTAAKQEHRRQVSEEAARRLRGRD